MQTEASPAATLAVNVFGCFTLEIINQYVARRTKLPAPLVKSMGVGLIGSFTTIAALSTENLAFPQVGQFGMFALYLSATAASTFGAAYLRVSAADALGTRRGIWRGIHLTDLAWTRTRCWLRSP